MISLRKLIYTDAVAPAPAPPKQPGAHPSHIVESYRDAMVAFGEHAKRALPPALGDLQRNLVALNNALSGNTGEAVSPATRQRLRQELSDWSDRAVRLHAENERELKEIMSGVTRAAETIGKRDEKYGSEIRDITTVSVRPTALGRSGGPELSQSLVAESVPDLA